MSKKSDIYATDVELMQLFGDWFDPCELSTHEGLRACDGLGSDWKDRTFVNPPYSNPLPWVEQAIKENRKGKLVVMLLKHDSSTIWYARLQEAGALFLWVNGRLRFNTGTPANFPSMIAVLPRKNISEVQCELFV